MERTNDPVALINGRVLAAAHALRAVAKRFVLYCERHEGVAEIQEIACEAERALAQAGERL